MKDQIFSSYSSEELKELIKEKGRGLLIYTHQQKDESNHEELKLKLIKKDDESKMAEF